MKFKKRLLPAICSAVLLLSAFCAQSVNAAEIENDVSTGALNSYLFGYSRIRTLALAQFLSGLGEAYPDFLSVTFTHDLEKISLREGKTSADVLALIGR